MLSQAILILLASASISGAEKSFGQGLSVVDKWPREVLLPWRAPGSSGVKGFREQPTNELGAIEDGWMLVEDGCATANSMFLGKRYVKFSNVPNSATDYAMPRIVLLYADDGDLAGVQSVLPLAAALKLKPEQPHYQDFVASPRYQPDEKLGKILGIDVLVKTAYFRAPSHMCHYCSYRLSIASASACFSQLMSRFTIAFRNSPTDLPTVYLQNDANPHLNLLSIPEYVGNALVDKDTGYKHIDHKEPGGGVTQWFEHKCTPIMGVHWFPVSQTFNEAKCGDFTWDHAVYDPNTDKMIGLVWTHLTEFDENDKNNNPWLDGPKNPALTDYQAVDFNAYMSPCLLGVNITSTHVYFGKEVFGLKQCNEPTRCNSLMNCGCPKEDGKTVATSKCLCNGIGAQSCTELMGG